MYPRPGVALVHDGDADDDVDINDGGDIFKSCPITLLRPLKRGHVVQRQRKLGEQWRIRECRLLEGM